MELGKPDLQVLAGCTLGHRRDHSRKRHASKVVPEHGFNRRQTILTDLGLGRGKSAEAVSRNFLTWDTVASGSVSTLTFRSAVPRLRQFS